MKFLHTSDWHLGARLAEYGRLPEQQAVLEELRILAENERVDFVIVAGDIFDNYNPPNDAVELLYRELKKLSDDGHRPVIVIAGNHDSPDRIEAPDPLAAECGIFFIGYPDFTRGPVELESGVRAVFPEKGIMTLDIPERPQVRIITTPYANENRLRKYLDPDRREEAVSEILGDAWKALSEKYCDKSGINILTAHLFMAERSVPGELFEAAGPSVNEPDEERSILHPGGLELIDAALIPEAVQYTALGHLHRPGAVRNGKSPAVYSGSPLALGLSEEDQQKSAVLVSVEPGGVAELKFAPVESGRRILRRTFADIDEAVRWLGENPECYVEVLVECDKYISAADRRRLYAAHDGITAVVPLSPGTSEEGGLTGAPRRIPDLTESVEELFKSYFEYAKGMAADQQIMNLFREVAALNGEEDET